MEKRSKVTNVSGAGSYEGKYGTMHKFNVTFENGDTGQYQSKEQEQSKFVIGQEADYTIETKGQYTNIKPVYQQKQGGKSNYNSPERLEFDKEKFQFEKKKQIMIIEQSCTDYAIKILQFNTTEGFGLADVIEMKDKLVSNILQSTKKYFPDGQN